ncbi:C-type mannose receptor 2-like [Mercenaria mercenaria]|uniref:C-type mannose receptor 2-like n=1 Tax=Mercenaria mercenaria TaxID=6596 RepID=UPI00234F8967|nr:C-type mannose receptor 2-like [Mercenaria mercenaria]
MYEFDCKPDGGQSSDGNWFSVAYEHQVGYIAKNDQLQVQTCMGSVPDEDKLSPITNTSTIAPTTPVPATTNKPTTITTIPASTTTIESITSTKQTTTVTTENIPTNAPTTAEEPSITPFTEVTTTLQPTTVSSTMSPTQNPKTSNTWQLTTTKTITLTQLHTITKPSSQKPITNTIQGHLEFCSSRIQHAAQEDHAILAQFGDNCFEVDKSTVSWSHAESICQQNGGHLTHIANQKEQNFIHNFLVRHHSHTVWIGLHDRNYEENFEWTSGDSVTYTNWQPGRKKHNHDVQDCVFMSPSTGLWNDRACGGDTPKEESHQDHRHAYICQFGTVTATTGNLNLCSSHLHQQASRDAGTLAQYGQSCYEIVPDTNKTWGQAESFCQNRGGHLAHISNSKQQSFIQGFMQRYSPHQAVWIGLTDHHSEGHFHWTSGDTAHYTNWVPNHISNFEHHSKEDCVVFIPYKHGKWDDLPCGSTVSTHHHVQAVGEVHPILCQYSTTAGPPFIG